MRVIRTLAIVVFLIGLFYFGVGVLILLSLENALQVTELAHRAGMKAAQNFDPATWLAGLIFDGVSNTLIGALAIISGAGLFRAKEWARKLWLGVTIPFALLSLWEFISHYRSGLMDRGDWIGLSVVSAVICMSWSYLTSVPAISLFQRDP